MRFVFSLPGILIVGGLSTMATVAMVSRASSAPPAAHTGAKEETAQIDAKGALSLLAAGNQRWVDGKPQHPNESSARRSEVAGGQHPFVVVVTCSDSRVPPEVLFDRGVGDIFVVRTAGQVIDEAALGSIEYGLEHLHAPLLMILGHSKCGAVQATCDAVDKEQHVEGAIGHLIESITPAATKTAKVKPGRVDAAIEANVELIVESLPERSKIIEELAHEKKIQLVGAIYDLGSGKVKQLD
ncbi:MAG: carbonic anhydrase [Fimbriimonadaceae bacterium]|nr:carbonic anhydrase [Fimbriimonadaceae bacterium]